MADQRPAQSTTEYRVAVVNDGTPFGPLYLHAADAEAAEERRVSWSSDPGQPHAEVWIERREIGPWERV
jgi:hypothetical protein